MFNYRTTHQKNKEITRLLRELEQEKFIKLVTTNKELKNDNSLLKL